MENLLNEFQSISSSTLDNDTDSKKSSSQVMSIISNTYDEGNNALENLLVQTQALRNKIESDEDISIDKTNLKTLANETNGLLRKRFKEARVACENFNNMVDKEMCSGMEECIIEDCYDESDVQRIIQDYFLRTGQFQAAELYSKEANIEYNDDMLEKIKLMHQIDTDLSNQDPTSCIKCICEEISSLRKENDNNETKHNDNNKRRKVQQEKDKIVESTCELDDDNDLQEWLQYYISSQNCDLYAKKAIEMDKLLFQIAKLIYISLINDQTNNNRMQDALGYATKHFSKFLRHQHEISALLGCLLFLPSTVGVPDVYQYILSIDKAGMKKEWLQLQIQFKQFYLSSIGLNRYNPLVDVFKASSYVFPQVLKYIKILKSQPDMKKMNNKDNNNENINHKIHPMNGVTISLPKELQFHSIFICPVTKTEENNAMLLRCGHVISSVAVMKMHDLSRYDRFKCPYCPSKQSGKDLKIVSF